MKTCGECGKKIRGIRYRLCLQCRQTTLRKNRRRRNALRSKIEKGEHLCSICGKTWKGKKNKTCFSCRRKRKDQRVKLRTRQREEQRCINCGSKKILEVPEEFYPKYIIHPRKNPICEGCWFKGLAYKHFGSTKKWTILKKLFVDQKGRCAYTGRALYPGGNASLDHKVCKFRGGKTEVPNLQWVDYDINILKGTMGDEELFELIISILKHNGYKVKKCQQN